MIVETLKSDVTDAPQDGQPLYMHNGLVRGMGLPRFIMEREVCIARHNALFTAGSSVSIVLTDAETAITIPKNCTLMAARLVTQPSPLVPYPNANILMQCSSQLNWRYSRFGSYDEDSVASAASQTNGAEMALVLTPPGYNLEAGSVLALYNYTSAGADIGLSCDSYYSSVGLLLQLELAVIAGAT